MSGRAHPWRIVIMAVGIVAVVNLLILAVRSADTDDAGGSRGDAVESVTPPEGTLQRPQDQIGVNLRDDLVGTLAINGVPIPEDQVTRVSSLGEVTFRPGPDKEFERLPTGEHTVVVTYASQTAPERALGSYTWTFRTE